MAKNIKKFENSAGKLETEQNSNNLARELGWSDFDWRGRQVLTYDS